MLPDDRLRELLHGADERAAADPRALASIFSNVDAERRRRSRRPGWYASFVRAVPALVGVAAALVVLVGIVGLLPDIEPAATPSPSPTRSLVAPSPLGSPATPSRGPSSDVPPYSDELFLEDFGPLIGTDPDPADEIDVWKCVPWTTSSGGDDVLSPTGYASSFAHASCPGPANGTMAQYAVYESRAALRAEYDAIMSGQGVAAGGACADGAPANAPWDLPGYPDAGALGCFARNGGVQYIWTDDGRHILGQWLASDNAKGLAFWQEWTTTPTDVENLPAINAGPFVADADTCRRTVGLDYAGASLATECPRPGGVNSVFYAQYYVRWMRPGGFAQWLDDLVGLGSAPDPMIVPTGDPFPDDPMTVEFFSLMAEGGVKADTTEGCYEGTSGRYMWGLLRPGFTKDTGRVSDPATAMGYVGCYVRAEGSITTTRLVFTSNKFGLMVVWDAPDFEAARTFLPAWALDMYLVLR